MSMKNSNDTIWDRTSDLPISSTAPEHCATAVLIIICTSYKHQQSCQINDDEIGEACCTDGTEWKHIRVLVNEHEGDKPIGRPMHRWDDDLKTDLKQTAQMWTGFSWLKIGTICTFL